MTGVTALTTSSIGKKVIMAVTGLILVGFVFIHMLGNLKVYQGAESLNLYALHLRELGEPILAYGQALWIARIVLLLAVGAHIWAAVSLTLQNRAGRPTGYDKARSRQPAYTYAAYTMRWGGVVILLFVIFHILHFTLGVVGYGGSISFIHPEGGEYFAYQNVVAGFGVWYVSLFYIVAMIAVGLHIYHGFWSMFQTIGWNNTRYTNAIRTVALLIALAIVVGNVSIPLAVMTGLLPQVPVSEATALLLAA